MFLINFIKFEVIFVSVPTAISWGIIDDYYFIVCVVLLKDWIEVVFDSKVGVVVITWNNDANRYLISWKMEFLLHSYKLFLIYFYSQALCFFINYQIVFW